MQTPDLTGPRVNTSSAYDVLGLLPGAFTLNGAGVPDTSLFGGSVKAVRRLVAVSTAIVFRVTLSHNMPAETRSLYYATLTVPAEQDARVVVASATVAGDVKDPVTELDVIVRDAAGVPIDTVGIIVNLLPIRNQ